MRITHFTLLVFSSLLHSSLSGTFNGETSYQAANAFQEVCNQRRTSEITYQATKAIQEAPDRNNAVPKLDHSDDLEALAKQRLDDFFSDTISDPSLLKKLKDAFSNPKYPIEKSQFVDIENHQAVSWIVKLFELRLIQLRIMSPEQQEEIGQQLYTVRKGMPDSFYDSAEKIRIIIERTIPQGHRPHEMKEIARITEAFRGIFGRHFMEAFKVGDPYMLVLRHEAAHVPRYYVSAGMQEIHQRIEILRGFEQRRIRENERRAKEAARVTSQSTRTTTPARANQVSRASDSSCCDCLGSWCCGPSTQPRAPTPNIDIVYCVDCGTPDPVSCHGEMEACAGDAGCLLVSVIVCCIGILIYDFMQYRRRTPYPDNYLDPYY
ncbi:hypothetical protein PGT21_029468 [Puccinia graminis f. sp. tritici]|uniref:Uncharacterized protein n=1 Tax=Puccinia graminis f. sp. tritici TaxID=56615 RepID=A0A5B0QJ61_PUCGR|nr:hypothetical protein PGT21_029468 [Puccinia graminis f. sp. tritici]